MDYLWRDALMSFFKKTLASIGIGSARVDSVVQQEFLTPGENINVTIEVYGGSTPQEIENIDLKVYCRYFDEEKVESNSNDSSHERTRKISKNYVLASWTLPYSFTIESGQHRQFDVELILPLNTPVSIGDTKVWLETGLDISLAKDPTDKDMLTIRPDAMLDGIFAELEEQGLRIRQVECEAATGFSLPFVQEFEFVPTTGPFHGLWRELEIVVHRHPEALELWFEIDRQKEGIGGMLSSLLGAGKLKRNLKLPVSLSGKEAGLNVIQYLESTIE